MPPNGVHLDVSVRSVVVRTLLLGWRPDIIAEHTHCDVTSVRRIQSNLYNYGRPSHPFPGQLGRRKSLTVADEDALLQWLARQPTANLDEMRWYLWEERSVMVSISTISRTLGPKRRAWSKKKARREAQAMSMELRAQYLLDMSGIWAHQMVVLDESLFNETTGWRLMSWAPIGQPGRYSGDRNRGHSWSLLAAYTSVGYLPCVAVREGSFNREEFLEWLTGSLLPLCQPYPQPNSVIVLDNVGIHLSPDVEEAIQARGCMVRYLPPYSPDLSPIELTFSVLKAWVRRRFHLDWPEFNGTFGQWLLQAVELSGCDRFAVDHFRHAGNGGYMFEGDMDEFEERLRLWERGRVDELWTAPNDALTTSDEETE